MHAKYWTAFNHMINNQLADALLPYYEPKYVYGVLDIPYKFKYLGVFKAALIRYIDPALAKYPTQNGITFNDFGNIPPRVKISTFIKYHVPIMLRPYIRAHFWNQENKGKFPYYLTKEYLDTIPISPDLAISEYVDIDKIKDPDMFSRVLSVELLLNGKL